MPLCLLLLLALILLPLPPSRRAEAFRGAAFAHRGLHGEGAPENTLSAFRRAVEAGAGIELDLRLSRDGVPMVFHDETLSRMTGREEAFSALTRAELQALPLPAGECIPTLDEALRLVGGRVPLLIELKHGTNDARLCRASAARLQSYAGAVLLESFHPSLLFRMRRLAPQRPRGLLLTRSVCAALARLGPAGEALLNGPLPFLLGAGADFLACARPPLRCRRRGRLRAWWTVRDEAELRQCRQRGDMVIFEGMAPAFRVQGADFRVQMR